MNADMIMIHYGELSTKGDNRKAFIACLLHNVRCALKPYGVESKADRDHIYVYLAGKDPKPIFERLKEVAGIQRLSLVMKAEPTLEAMQEAALALLQEEKGAKTFKLDVKRVNKRFPLDSYGISCAVADYVLDHSSLTVDLHEPDARVKITLRVDASYLSCHEELGLGGYPLGMIGKVTMLLSGGIDSPVASYALIRRGIRIECLHFASPPYTSMAVVDKLKDILAKLNVYQSDIKLQVLPFTKIQEAIYDNVPEPYCITTMRRMMIRLAVAMAKKNKCLAVATGESIGQVASQTLESIGVIEEVTNFPILRPLCATDKLSIIETSKRIDTYDISIRPYEDCCTIFKPKKPKTRPHLDECLLYESRFDYESLIQECLAGVETIYFSEGQEVQK
ncbi:MAG: tRNA 4-thiouridine(8) synthase ThiI [Erysipelotrichaceae bacterium]|nr:tRNA 4-thiouridine(8) synthase ThiI [Erysipelotrichaceae bacterium]